jgi:hypothetical protein
MKSLMRQLRWVLACAAVALGVGIGVSGRGATGGDSTKPATSTGTATAPTHFALRIYGKRVDVKYQYADLTAAAGDLASQEPVVTLTEEDVAAFQADAAPSSRMLIGLTDQSSRRWSAALAGMKDTQPFTVSLDGRTLYLGVVYTMIGAAAIQTPVLHIQDNKGRMELRLGAWQGAWYGMGRGDASRLEQKDVRALFEKRGVLSTLPAR